MEGKKHKEYTITSCTVRFNRMKCTGDKAVCTFVPVVNVRLGY